MLSVSRRRFLCLTAGTGAIALLAAQNFARIDRQRLWVDRRDLTGPFDIIGDVHGCFDELEALLKELGYKYLMDWPMDDQPVWMRTRKGRIQTWDGKKWNLASDWITSDDSVIAPMVKEAAAKYAAEKKLTPGCLVTN